MLIDRALHRGTGKRPELLNHGHAHSFDRCVARGLDPWRWPNGSQPLGTRMSVYEHDFESPWLWDVNRTRGNSHISLALV